MESSRNLGLDVIRRISEAHDELSKSQQKVVEFMLNTGLEALYMTSSQIADAVDVNRSTVVRTAQALGYEGFSDLQAALQDHFAQQYSTRALLDVGSHNLIEQFEHIDSSDPHSVLRHMVQIETQKLANLPELIPSSDFARAVNILVNSRSVKLIGFQLSKSVVLNLYYPLLLIKSDCHLLEYEPTILTRHLASLSDEDVVFAVSNYPYARATFQAVDYARRTGATIIALTDSHVSPIAKRADVAFVIPPRLWLYGNSVVPFALVNALSAATMLRMPEPSQTTRRRVETIYEQLQVFIDDDEL